MDPLIEFGLQASRWLQQQYPGLEPLMQAISALGRFEAYLAILPLVYWSLSKALGRSLIYVIATCQMITGMAKQAFRGPRPYWLEPGLGLSDESSYGVPSGHTSTAVVAYGYLAARLRHRLAWIAALLFIFLMALSRVYLGVHMVHDVLAGALLGLAILVGFLLYERDLGEGYWRRILGQKLLVAVVAPLLLSLIYVALRLLLPPPSASASWAAFQGPAEAQSLDEIVQAAGILLGLGWGFIMESSRVRFRVDGAWWLRLLRYGVGMVGILIIWRGLGTLFPDDPLWLGLPLRLLRYTLLGLWGAYYAPWLFVRLRLAPADPPPEINLTIRPLDKVQS